MRAHVLLADFAQPDSSGKMGALGLGWSITTTPTPPHAVIVLLKVGWTETNKPHQLQLSLLTADGQHAVVAPTPFGDQPLTVEAKIEVGRPAGLPEGSAVEHNFAINLGAGIPLAAASRYEWRLTIDGKENEEWAAPFFVRPSDPA